MTARKEPICVLVVEDEASLKALVVEALSGAGLRIEDADNAEQAIRILDEYAADIHILFTDVHMLGLIDGLALARHVRQRWPWIRVIVTSGRAQPESGDIAEGLCFVQKPYGLQQIIRQIQLI